MVLKDLIPRSTVSRPRPSALFPVSAGLFLLILLSLPTELAAAFESPYQIGYIAPDFCCTDDGLIRCGSKLEKRALSSPDKAVSRDNGKLCLPVLMQDALCFTDQKNIHYTFAGEFSVHYMVLEILDESWELLLVAQDDGQQTRLPSYPVPNPSNTKFATASFDVDAGYAPNLVQIRDLPVTKEPLLEIRDFPENQGPVSITWYSDTELHINLAGLDERSGDRMIVQQTSSGWAVSVIRATEIRENQKTTN